MQQLVARADQPVEAGLVQAERVEKLRALFFG